MTTKVLIDSCIAILGGILAFLVIYQITILAMMLTGKLVTGVLAALVLIFYGNMVAVAQTGLDIPGGRQADPVAGAAEFPMNGADKTDTARKAVDPVIAGGAIAVGTGIRDHPLGAVMGAQASKNLRVGHRLQGFSVADGHQLDKTYVQLMVFRKLRQGDTFHIVDAPLENGVDLDRNPAFLHGADSIQYGGKPIKAGDFGIFYRVEGI